ncbi:hypothetical protein BDR26DRAFT_917708 [Obelidium mucronatum]|nr:hypothetical protein BDR26DRAFT_917708 [Obelidium mucronatum]
MHIEFIPTQPLHTQQAPPPPDSDSDGSGFSGFSGLSGLSGLSRHTRGARSPRSTGSGSGSAGLVTGHLGVTPAAVAGLVRVRVDPAFSSKHPRILTRPVLEVRLKGSVRTSSGPSASFLRQTPLNSLAWIDKTIINERLSFADPLDLGLRRDASGALNVLLPGTYEVPFRFPLPNILPPSFKGFDGRVSYVLSAKIYFKERSPNGGIQYFDKLATEQVLVRRYNAEHIINASESLDLRASSPVPQYPYDPHPSDESDSSNAHASNRRISQIMTRVASSSSSRRPSQMSMELNPANLSPPAQPASPTAGPSAIIEDVSSSSSNSQSGMLLPPLSLTRTLTGEVDVISDNFTEPATFSNLDSEDPVRYHIIVPSRSFGPDDPIVVNVHVSKVPDGFEVHHIDVIVRAEVTSKTVKGGTKLTSQIIMKHRDVPENAGSFWNRKININSSKLFRNHSYETVNISTLDSTSPNGNGSDGASAGTRDGSGNTTTDESSSEGVVTGPRELPPRFDAIHSEFTIPRNFSSYPIVNRRNMLIDAMNVASGGGGDVNANGTVTEGTLGVGMTREAGGQPSSSSAAPMALDSGISAGNSSVFQPWTLTEERPRSPSMRRAQSIDGAGVAGSLRSPTPSLLGALPTFIRARSSRATEITESPEHELSQARNSADINVENDIEGEDDTSESDARPASLDSVHDPGSEPPAEQVVPLPTAQRTRSNRASLTFQTLTRALSMRSTLSYGNSGSISGAAQAPPPRMETPPLPPTAATTPLSNTRPAMQRTASSPPATMTTTENQTLRNNRSNSNSNRLLKPIRKIMNRFMSSPAQETKPLNTFTSPFLSVRHVLRIQIVCHKPIPLVGIGSQPIYIEPNTHETKIGSDSIGVGVGVAGGLGGSGGSSSSTEAFGFKSILRKALPLGFRYTTAVETGCVVHPASERDRTFLQSYLYGPVGAGGVVNWVNDESHVPAYEGPPPPPPPPAAVPAAAAASAATGADGAVFEEEEDVVVMVPISPVVIVGDNDGDDKTPSRIEE